METALKKEKYISLEPVWSGSAGQELKEDYVVPDTMPDIGAILHAEGLLTVERRETGAGYVSVSASAELSVVYLPEGGGAPRSLTLTLPAELRMDAPGVDEECPTAVGLRMKTVEARVVNSRKIALRAELSAEAQCYRREETEIVCGAEQEGEAVQILRRTASVVRVTDIREKTFVVTDTYSVPAPSEGHLSILSRRAEAWVEDVKCVGGKAVFRGRIRSELIFPAEGDSVTAGRFETEFSQIMDLGAEDGELIPEITVFLTAAYHDLPEYGGAEGGVEAEFHLAAQCALRERIDMPYIADIYSNSTELTPVVEERSCFGEVRSVTARQTVAGRTEGEEPGEPLFVTAAVGAVTREEGAVKTTVGIRLIGRKSDGSLAASRCRLSVEFTASDIPEGAQLCDITVTVADVYSTGASGDVRATLRMDALAVTEERIRCVTAVTEDEDAWKNAPRRPSVTLVRWDGATDLWTVAKRYHSTVEAIRSVNDGTQAGFLLVPKGREKS